MLIDTKIFGKLANIEKVYERLRFEPVMTLEAQMAQTREHFRSVLDASTGLTWSPVATGAKWGDSGVSAWIRATVVIPDAIAGRSAFLRANTGAKESLFIVDGVCQGVFDENHPVRLICLSAKAGARHEIALEGYAGHTFPGTQPYYADGQQDDPSLVVRKNSLTFDSLEIVVEREDVSAFVFDLRTMRQLAEVLDESSLRRGRVQQALGDVFSLVYAKPEDASQDEWRPALAAARNVMRPLLDLRNGPTAPTIGIIGHSHIDTAWLWTIKETWRKTARTFSSVLSLMDQYPEFRFTQSAAYHADTIKRLYPDIFERIKQRVKEGRWEVNGAMWVEPDCNIPSGEAFVRQCLVGQTATREMFGVTSDTLWQPDVFGYSAALPQILQGSGVRYFCTTKLGWNDTNKFPYDTFVWQGLDGSSVIAHFNLIHCWPDPATLTRAWREVQHKDVQDRRLMSFGYGDGGGGPMAEMIEMGRRTADLEGCPKAEYQSVSEFMNGVEHDLPQLPKWVGELYLELHRGTLTSIAPIKRLNRKCELALRDAEFAATLASVYAGASYPADRLLESWKTLLVNQFHDILPGSSIAQVNDDAIESFMQCLGDAHGIRDDALSVLVQPVDNSTVLVNSLSWDRIGEIEIGGLPADSVPVGDGVVTQRVSDIDGAHKVVVSGIDIPALGYRAVPIEPVAASASPSAFRVECDIVETPFARVRFDEAGRIVSYYDIAARRELVKEGGAFNAFLLGEDVPQGWDNWDIDRDQRLKLLPVDGLLSSKIEFDGPLQLRIRHERAIGNGSVLCQQIVFHALSPQVDFETVVDWNDKYRFLKVAFALEVLADTARHEIQFGHVVRSAHDNTSVDRAQFDVCAHKWTDISENGFGVAFLNDCKYACTVKDGEYRLSLIKSGRHPDPRGDQGRHRFTYAVLPHAGGFSVESVVRPAYELNVSPVVVHGVVKTSAGAGTSLVSVDAPNVIVEAIKAPQVGDGFVLRLYEAGKTGTHAKIRFGVPVGTVSETNLLEENPRSLAVSGGSLDLYFRPFEIKTLVCRPL